MAAPFGPPPWSDAEKNFLLAELIKQAGPSPQQLLGVLSSMNLQHIRWGDIPLPQGRTLNETMQVWNQLQRTAPSIQPVGILPAGLQTPSPLSAPMPLKRPFPFDTNLAGREIRPKPSSTANIYGQITQIEQPPKKKRGRPTKQEAAARAEAQALAVSGESSTGPRALRTQGVASTPTAPGASEPTEPSTAEPSPADDPRVTLPPPVSRMPISSILTPTAPKSASHSSSSSGKRRRAKSSRSEPEDSTLAGTSRSRETQLPEYESPYARMAPQPSTSPARTAAMRHREDFSYQSSQQPESRPSTTSQPPTTTTTTASSSPEYTRSM